MKDGPVDLLQHNWVGPQERQLAPRADSGLSAEAVWKLGGCSLLGRNLSQLADFGSDRSHGAFLIPPRAWDAPRRTPNR